MWSQGQIIPFTASIKMMAASKIFEGSKGCRESGSHYFSGKFFFKKLQIDLSLVSSPQQHPCSCNAGTQAFKNMWILRVIFYS